MASKAGVGRVAGKGYWREADARVMVEALEESGETLAAFARRYQVSADRLGRWRGRLQGEEAAAVSFHPVRLSGGAVSKAAGAIEVELRGGRRVRVGPGFEAEDLRRVVAVLEGELGAC